MVSKRLLEIIGLKINVYGLEEYKALPENTPLSAMFFCHGFAQSQKKLESHCQRICQLNETRCSNGRYLILITIDHPNVGTRKAYDEQPFPKPGTFEHQDLVFKMYMYAKSTALTIPAIIECFDFYAFGIESKSFVGKWGIIGHSMGGIAAEVLPTLEPKVSTVIMISTCLRSDKWLPYFAKSCGLEADFYGHKSLLEIIWLGTKNAMHGLRNINLLVLYGEKDVAIPKWLINDTLDELRITKNGKEGYDWKCKFLPGSKHGLDGDYITNAMQWIEKWMIEEPIITNGKLMANL